MRGPEDQAKGLVVDLFGFAGKTVEKDPIVIRVLGHVHRDLISCFSEYLCPHLDNLFVPGKEVVAQWAMQQGVVQKECQRIN